MFPINDQINLIYKINIGVSIILALVFFLTVQYLNPYLSYVNIWIIYFLGWSWLTSLSFLGWFIIKKYYLKGIIFLQTIYKALFCSLVYSGISVLVALMFQTENLNSTTISIFVISTLAYSTFQFLEF